MPDSDTKKRLKRNASLLDVVMLGAGSAIGSSIFSVLGPAASIGGNSLLWAIIGAMVPMTILAIVYAAVASAAPRSGASFEWPRMFIGPRFSFFVAWLRIMGSVGMLVTGSLVLAEYLSVLTPLPATPVMFAIFVCLYLLNLFGISLAAKAQTVMMLLLIAAFSIFTVTALPQADFDKLTPQATGLDFKIIFLTLPLLIHLFMGIEAATEIGEEVHHAERNVPLGIALGVLLTLVVYLIITSVTLSVIGVEGVAASNTPLTEAARVAGEKVTLPLMLGAAVLCLVKSLNVNFLIFSRNLYVMSRSGVLPGPLSAIHPKWGTPHIAATAVFAMTCAGLLLPQNLVFLFVATSIPTLLKYFSTCWSAINLQNNHPDMIARAHFRLPPNVLRGTAVLGALFALGITAGGFGLDWRPYVLIVVWALLGAVYWKLVVSKRGLTTLAE